MTRLSLLSMPSQMESCRERRVKGRVNEQHCLLSALTVPRPLAFIKESYPFTLIKRQCFYLEGDPSEPAPSRSLTTNPPSSSLWICPSAHSFFSLSITQENDGLEMLKCIFPPQKIKKNRRKDMLKDPGGRFNGAFGYVYLSFLLSPIPPFPFDCSHR